MYVCEELREVVVAFRGTEQVSMQRFAPAHHAESYTVKIQPLPMPAAAALGQEQECG